MTSRMTWMGKEAVFRKLQELGTIDQAAVSIGYNDPIHWLRRKCLGMQTCDD